MRALPIDPLIPEIVAALAGSSTLVLEAAPGAGKTTRVPLALVKAGLSGSLRTVVAEPRRLAARLAAGYVARESGEAVGKTVGYSVRFEQAMGKDTRVLYATEGVLVRRLLEDPSLSDVGIVVLDEFHERHLTTDVLLALVRRLQKTERSDLRLVIMSATLEAEALAAHLGAPRLRSEGRVYPLTIEHENRPDDRPLDKRVASAVRKVLAEEPDGHVLVFLPGAREIRECSEALAKEAASGGVEVLPLHGDLPVSEQARAVEPGDRRRVILSTNVAESSVTIDGVTAVVDSGLSRVAGHSPWSGLPTLRTAKISRASAAQRAGRAGRTRPGRVIRLYSSGDLAARPTHDKPEILREDLAEAFLSLHGAGVRSVESLEWLDPPPAPAAAAAATLLVRLRATDPAGGLTDIGQRMLDFPLSPRLSRVVVEGERRGVPDEACLSAALLSERDIRTSARTTFADRRGGRGTDASGPSDVLELLSRFREAEDAGFDGRRLSYMELDARTARTVDQSRRKLSAIARSRGDRPADLAGVDEAVQIALLAGFPDRVARRKTRGERDLILFSGKSARLSETSVVHEAQFVVTLDAEETPRGIVVRLASAVEPDWLFELHPDLVEMTDTLAFNAGSGVVERTSRIACGSVVLEEDRKPAPPSEDASRMLADVLRRKTPPWYETDERVGPLLLRLKLLREQVPEANVPEFDAEALDRVLARACQGRTRLSELEDVSFEGELLGVLDPAQRSLLEKEVPERLVLPGGRAVTVHYEAGKPPWVESRLQDFFGMVKTPALGKGRLPLTVHLLAPNQRAVQVTTDLAGFWERHYPGIRRELCRRYPRHSWPEDGRAATPPPPKRR